MLLELCSCGMEIFSDGQLTDLRQKVDDLMKDELSEKYLHDCLLSLATMIDRAYSDNKSFLFPPF